jgi:hypothetical protein
MKRRRDATAGQCDRVWGQIVIARARGRCYLCKRMLSQEAHHIVFRGQTHDPTIRFDPDFGVGLCYYCHHHAADAPHVNNKVFLEAIGIWMVSREPARWAKIEPVIFRPIPPFCGTVDYSEIAAGLRDQLRLCRSLT